MINSQQIDLIQTFNTSHASANTIDQYFSLLGQSGINMNYNNGTYLLYWTTSRNRNWLYGKHSSKHNYIHII